MVEMERYIRRGEMFWVRSTDTWGCETASSRPGVVVSSQFGIDHSPVVTIVYCTSQPKTNGCCVELKNTDRPSWAMCNQIFTVDKNRLGNKLCTVSEDELDRIDDRLAYCLGLVIHTREIDVAMEAAKAQVAGLEEELMAKRVEIAMLERLYEKALDMMAGARLTSDVQKKPEQPKVRVPRIVPDEPEYDEEIDRRHSASTDGGKVNINTASAKEISERTGLPMTPAYSIVGTRKRRGCNYKSLEELLEVPRFTEHHWKKYGPMMEV